MCEICRQKYEALNPEIEKAMMELTPEFTELLDKAIKLMPETTEIIRSDKNGGEISMEDYINSLPEDQREETRATAQHVMRVNAAVWLSGFYATRWAQDNATTVSAQLVFAGAIHAAFEAGVVCDTGRTHNIN